MGPRDNFGMPHILVRFMSIKNSKMIKKSSAVACIWVVLSLGAAIMIAYLGRTYIMSDGKTALADAILPGSTLNYIYPHRNRSYSLRLWQDLFSRQ